MTRSINERKNISLLSIFNPFSNTHSRPSSHPRSIEPDDREPDELNQTGVVHLRDLSLSSPIPLKPQDIPLPRVQLRRGPSPTTTSTATEALAYHTLPASFLGAGSNHAYAQDNTYHQRIELAVDQTPSGLPSHLSLSTMGFANSPFRVFMRKTPSPASSTLAIDQAASRQGIFATTRQSQTNEFGQLEAADSDLRLREREPSSWRELPTLASAFNLQEGSKAQIDANKPARDPRSDTENPSHSHHRSTWRNLSRSFSRTSIFETWGGIGVLPKSRSKQSRTASVPLGSQYDDDHGHYGSDLINHDTETDDGEVDCNAWTGPAVDSNGDICRSLANETSVVEKEVPEPLRRKMSRKMSIDNLVNTFSRRKSHLQHHHQSNTDNDTSKTWQFNQNDPLHESEHSGHDQHDQDLRGGRENYDERRWTALYSEASDVRDSMDLSGTGIGAASGRGSIRVSRLALPPLRSMRSKFSLTMGRERAGSVAGAGGAGDGNGSRRGSLFDGTSISRSTRRAGGSGGGVIRLSALFHRPVEQTHSVDAGASTQFQGEDRSRSRSRTANNVFEGPLKLSEVQDTVEITKTPSTSHPTPSPSSPQACRPLGSESKSGSLDDRQAGFRGSQVGMTLIQPSSAVASALTLALSPARDDISVLDPCRTPMGMSLSISMQSLARQSGVKSQVETPAVQHRDTIKEDIRVVPDLSPPERARGDDSPSTREITAQTTKVENQTASSSGCEQINQAQSSRSISMTTSTSSNTFSSAHSGPVDSPGPSRKTRLSPGLPPSEYHKILLSTLSSLRSISEMTSSLTIMTSSDSSESLAAKMKQSLSELKSAFRRMRNMSDREVEVDLAMELGSMYTSGTSSNRTSGHARAAEGTSSSFSELPIPKDLIAREVEEPRSDDGDNKESPFTSSSVINNCKVTTYMGLSESLSGFDIGNGGNAMSCAPSGTSWHTAREELQVSIGDLRELRATGKLVGIPGVPSVDVLRLDRLDRVEED